MSASGQTKREAIRGELREEALSRLRICAPVVAIVLMVGVIVSPLIGVSISGAVLAVNALTIAVASVAFDFAWRRGVAPRFAHLATAVVWGLLPVTTVATLVLTGRNALVVPLIGALIIAPLMMVSRRAIAIATVVVAAAWWLLMPLGDTTVDHDVARIAVLGSAVVANAAAYLSGKLLERGVHLRLELRAANRRLRRELNERRRTESERETFRDQFIAAQRSEAMGSLAAGLAHEMNNILAGILTASELLAEDAEDEDTHDWAEAIVEEAKRGGALTQSMLAFARREGIQRVPAELDALAQEVVHVLPRTLPRTITLEHNLKSDAVVSVDRAQLIQAILNLGINGADAIGDRQGTLTLVTGHTSVSTFEAGRLGIPAGDYAMVSVSDTGKGMDAETCQRAFEPFYTTKGPGKGTGLGLAMVHDAVEAFGGAVELQSVVGQGTTIRLLLPVFEGTVTKTTPQARRQESIHGKVLVVDDEPMVRETLTAALSRIGLLAVEACDGLHALAELGAHPDLMLVVCDMDMPVMDGPTFVRTLREEHEVPVLLVSGKAADRGAQQLIDEGLATGHLAKPFTRRELLDAVDAVLPSDDSTEMQAFDPRDQSLD